MPTVSRAIGELHSHRDIPSAWVDREPRLYLHLGESPFPPTPGVQRALRDAVSRVNAYPDSTCRIVRKKLAAVHGYGLRMENFICGNGSDDLIDLIALTYAGPNSVVASFDPTFFVYRSSARRHGAHYISIPRQIENDFVLPDPEHLNRGLIIHRPQVIFLANPNNPTGTLTPRSRIEEILVATQGGPLVVVDECYFDYSEETVMDLIPANPHLFILRSLSKGGSLAGLRFGYGVGHPDVINTMHRAALTFPVNALAQVAAEAVLDELEEVQRRARTIAEEREQLAQALRALQLDVASSAANMLLISSSHSATLPADAAAQLAELGILVSDQSRTIGTEKTYLRVGIGFREHSERLVEALKRLIQNTPAGE